MDHRKLDTTKGYYRISEPVGARPSSGWPRSCSTAMGTMSGERRRHCSTPSTPEALGEVAVPFGVCTEPSNVKAGGGACQFRFRCAGCDHFRTDVSYLPNLQAYLDDLLRNRERILATTELDDWVVTRRPCPQKRR